MKKLVSTILSYPQTYDFLRKNILKNSLDKKVIDYFNFKDGDVVLDIGCGTAKTFDSISANVEYFGFDENKKYIDAARQRLKAYIGEHADGNSKKAHLFNFALTENNSDKVTALVNNVDKVITSGV